MKFFDWGNEKNAQLESERNVTFEETQFWIMRDGLLDILEHPNKKRYPSQRVFLVNMDDYAYIIPFAENGDRVFLKTIIPSRIDDKDVLEGRMRMMLDREEKQLLESVEKGEWQSISDLESEADQYQAYVKATFRKDKRMNIRISERVLIKLQQEALAEGVPYQTLIGSILHKYISGRLVEREP